MLNSFRCPKDDVGLSPGSIRVNPIGRFADLGDTKRPLLGVDPSVWISGRQEDDVEAVSPGTKFIVQDRQLYLV